MSDVHASASAFAAQDVCNIRRWTRGLEVTFALIDFIRALEGHNIPLRRLRRL